MDEQVNPLERDLCLAVVLPGGLEKTATVHGSKPVMDLLVTLCASYHLNPSDYTVEVLSPSKNAVGFKPNSPIGSLEAERIVLKPKGSEEKIRRPYMPEASVRLLINYNRSHKAVVRVNPRLPLELLLPAVCDKCEFNAETTVLLRDCRCDEPLDLTKTLDELGLREVFAKDAAERPRQPQTPETAVTPTEVISPPPLQDLPKKKKHRENTGFLSLFRRRKNKPRTEGAVTPPASPAPNQEAAVGMNGHDVSSAGKAAADVPKKRRAPPPPMGASQSVPNNLGSCHLGGPQRSAEPTLRSTKRRAPPPPCANSHQDLQADSEVKAAADPLNAVEELTESDESDFTNLSSSSSPRPSQPWAPCSSSSSRPSFAQLQEAADPYLPSFRGKDFSDARCALAKVLTSSVSKGTLVRRLRDSASFPKLYHASSSSFMSVTQRSSGNGVFCVEPVRTSTLPTQPEWEDPAQRKGTTTFKVVPSKKQHLVLEVPDQTMVEEKPGSEAPSEAGTAAEEGPRSPGRSPTPTQSPDPSFEGVQAPDRPLPVDLEDQDRAGSPLAEAGDKQEEEEEPEGPSEVMQAAPPACSDGELPTDGQINPEDQSEPPESPRRRSVEPCASHSDGREVEEEVVNGGETEEGKGEEEVHQEDEEVQQEEEEVQQADDEVQQEEVVKQQEGGDGVEEEEEEEDFFPPPPPPVFFDEDIEAMEEDPRASTRPPSSPRSPASTQAPPAGRQDQPTSSTSARAAASPGALDRLSAAPSRFAEAVALAVQRSRLQARGKGLGSQGAAAAGPSPPRSIYQFGA